MNNQILEKLNSLIELDEKPLTTKEACEYLNISLSYLYKLTHENRIPFFKPNGKMIYFLKSDLRTWLLRNRQSTADEIEQSAVDFVTLNSKVVK